MSHFANKAVLTPIVNAEVLSKHLVRVTTEVCIYDEFQLELHQNHIFSTMLWGRVTF